MKKLRIGVLMGGKSLEKEVSFNSGRTICDHLDPARYTVIPIFQHDIKLFILPWHFLHRGKTTDFDHRLENEATLIKWDHIKNHVDFIFIAQHGRYAEDGTLQGFLEILGVPYLGSGVFASALRIDKITQKTFLQSAGIETARYVTVEPHEIENFDVYTPALQKRLSDAGIYDNFVVKPSNEGSSLGVSIVQWNDLKNALQKASSLSRTTKKPILIEEKLIGMEFTCITLINHATDEYFSLPITEAVPEAGTLIFDYEQKYMPGRGIKYTPARCSVETQQRIHNACVATMRALEFNTMSKIDGFVTHDNRIVIIDPNTVSGFAPSSFIVIQAAEINLKPSDIINRIIDGELHRHSLHQFISSPHDTKARMLNKKIRVAVLLGGKSNEKETSLDSGRNVFYKLAADKYDAIPLFLNDNLELFHLTQSQLVRNTTKEIVKLLDESQKILWNDLPDIADFVFIGLHGGEGENGCVQGTLEMLGIPYNGSSVLASALCMNKYKANAFFADHGFDVPRNQLITRDEWLLIRPLIIDAQKNNTLNHLDTPLLSHIILAFFTRINDVHALIVKPHDDGCSVMVQKVENCLEFITAIDTVLAEKDAVLVEEFMMGMELTVGVVGNTNPRALPPSQTVAVNGILSIEEKFLPGAGENQTPAPLPQTALTFVQETIARAYKTIGCKGYARVDCFYQSATQSPTNKERVIILEVNTLPGLTPATCLFHQAAEIGLKPMEFIDMIVQFGFEEHGGNIVSEEVYTRVMINQEIENTL